MGKRRDGEHSLFMLADGRWAMEGYLPVGPGGARKRRRVSRRTQREARAAFAALEADAREGLTVPDDPALHTVTGWCQHWLDNVAAPGLKPSTRVGYQHALTKHITPAIGSVALAEVSIEMVDLLQAGISAEGLSRSSVVQARTVLRQAFDEAVRRGHLHRNPVHHARSPGRKPARKAEVFTPEQARALLAQAAQDGEGPRWLLALTLGLRQGERLGLSWAGCDIDGPDPSITISQTLSRVTGVGLVLAEPKTQSSRRTLRIPETVAQALREHRAAQNQNRLKAGPLWADTGLVFTTPLGTPVDPANDRKAWIALLERADVPYLKLHAARHTCATLLLNAGQEMRIVQEVLGHSSIAVTADIYGHVTGASVKAAVTVLSDMLVS